MRLFRRNIDGMEAVYLNGMLRTLVFALVGIFTPIYVYTQVMMAGYESYLGVVGVALFYLITRVATLVTAIPTSHLIEKIGFRRSIFVSAIFLAAYLMLLRVGGGNLVILAVAAILAGINIPLYWVARSSLISQDGERGKVGCQMGWLLTIEQASSVMGPLLAGLTIVKWGFPQLYLLALSVLILSVVPMWYMPHHTHRNGATWRGFFNWISDRRYFHQAIGVVGRVVDDYAVTIIWPLTIFVMGWEVVKLGGLFTLTAIVSIAVRYVFGKWFDVLYRKRDWSDELLFGLAHVGTSMVHLARVFITSVSSIFTFDLVGSVFGTLYGSMYINYQHLGGMRMGSIAYWVYVEMMYSVTAIILMIVVMVGAGLGIWREIVFIMAALWAILTMVQARESNMR